MKERTTIGKYKLLGILGKGAMGIVYKAFDPGLNREVAVKTLHFESLHGATEQERSDALKRFMNEARAAAKLDHSNIVTVYDVFQQEKESFIVMQYIVSQSLQEILSAGKKYSMKEISALVTPICDALDSAHKKGIVHRDIKPANILIDEEGKPFIADFGIARIETSNLTSTGTTPGTPSYMSPEQIKGEKVDGRSDLFSLGVILYELLAGKKPFWGQDLSTVAYKIVHEAPPPIKVTGDVPAEVNDFLNKCLAKNAENRYQSGRELAVDLHNLCRGEEETKLIDWGGGGNRITSAGGAKKRRLIALSAVAAAAVIFTVGFLLLKNRSGPSDPRFSRHIAITPFTYEASDLRPELIESLLRRSLEAGTELPVFSGTENDLYRRRARARGEAAPDPILVLSGDVTATAMDIRIELDLKYKGKRVKRLFSCKGTYDLITDKIDKMTAFVAERTEGVVKVPDKNSRFSVIATGSWDALNHFLNGKSAWDKLDSDSALPDFKSAVEIDPDFSLARLKLAEVKLFRSDRKGTREELNKALSNAGRLTRYDELRALALLARIDSNPQKEREYLVQLTEAFPLNKEYYYEYAESYFHCGDASEAVKIYTKALEIDPDFARAHNHIALCYSWLGRHDLAETHFLKYVDLDKSANAYDSLATGYMFAGRYDKAIEALEKGAAIQSTLDYLYGNMAKNRMRMGALAEAGRMLDKEDEITTRGNTRMDIQVNRAWTEVLRGKWSEAARLLDEPLRFYSADEYASNLDESPNVVIWMAGYIAAKRKNERRLTAMIDILAKKKDKFGVNATNYFPLYKFYLHLRALRAVLNGPDREGDLMDAVDEILRIKDRMGYWTSMFDLSFFLNEHAALLREIGRLDRAEELLGLVIEYNPRFAAARLNRALLFTEQNRVAEAEEELKEAAELLKSADGDFLPKMEFTRLISN